MRWYLAGPMSGIPQFNFPLFDRVTHVLRARGWDIVSPAELDDEADRAAALASDGAGDGANNGKTWGDFLARDVKLVADHVQGIILLPHWHTSRGARLEAYAGVLCKHPFFLVTNIVDVELLSTPTRYVLNQLLAAHL